jgi:hypothetical protein
VAQAVPREVEGIDLDLRLRALGDEADIAVRDAGFDLEMAVERRLVSRQTDRAPFELRVPKFEKGLCSA